MAGEVSGLEEGAVKNGKVTRMLTENKMPQICGRKQNAADPWQKYESHPQYGGCDCD